MFSAQNAGKVSLPGEVGDDDGYGQGDDQHAGEGADRAHDLTDPRRRHHVSIPEIQN